MRELFVMAQARRTGLGDPISWGHRETDTDSNLRMCVSNMINLQR